MHSQPLKLFMVISPTSRLNYLMKVSGDKLLIIEINHLRIKKFIHLPYMYIYPRSISGS